MSVALRSWRGMPSRRSILRALAGAGIALGVASPPAVARTKRKRKIALNAFGCVNVGDRCQRSEQCCSGICTGKQGKKTCRAHDSGVCVLGTDICGPVGPNAVCDPYDKKAYYCFFTTGNAPFWGDLSELPLTELCRHCRRDADCREEFGAGAACVLLQDDCAGPCAVTGGRACVAPGA
jgi:hypothetical protein